MIDELQRLLPWLSGLSPMVKAIILGGVAAVTIVAALLISLPSSQHPSQRPERQASDAAEEPQQTRTGTRNG